MRYDTGNPLDSDDARDLFDNAKNLDQFMLSQQRTFPDRLGVERSTLKALEDATPDAIAARDAAQTARDAAMTASDVALGAAGPMYQTEAEGRAAVANGETFKVQGSGIVAAYVYRRIDAGSSEFVTSFPASEAVENLQSTVFPVDGREVAYDYFVLEVSVFATREALPGEYVALDISPSGAVYRATDAAGNVIVRDDLTAAAIAARMPNYADLEVSVFSTRSALPQGAYAVQLDANGVGFVVVGEDGLPLDPQVAALEAEIQRALKAEAALGDRIVAGAIGQAASQAEISQAIGALWTRVLRMGGPLTDRGAHDVEADYQAGDVVTVSGVRYWTPIDSPESAPPASPWLAYNAPVAASGFGSGELVAMDSRAVARAASVMWGIANPNLAQPTKGLNVRLVAGQSISAAVSAFGHHSLLSSSQDYGVGGVLMIGQAERCANTELDHWEATGVVIKNDDVMLRPLKGTVRRSVYTYPEDGSAPLSDSAVDASNYYNSVVGESPFVLSSLEERRLRNRHLGRDDESVDQAVVLLNVGVGSTRLAWWLPGAAQNYFNRVLTAAQAAKALAVAQNLSVGIADHNFYQGVSDSQNVSIADRKSQLASYEAALRLQIEQGVMGQSRPAPLYLYAERPTAAGYTPAASAYTTTATYGAGEMTTAGYKVFVSLLDGNIGNNPLGGGSAWARMRCRYMWDAAQTYQSHDWVWMPDGSVWRSLVNGNTAEPSSSPDWTGVEGAWNNNGLAIACADLEYAQSSLTAVMVGPGYAIPDRTTHYGINGSKWLGAYRARVGHHVVTQGRRWLPTHITSAHVRGPEVVLMYHAPVPPLRIAPAWDVNSPVMLKDLGLRVYDDLAPLELQDPPVSNPVTPPYAVGRGVQGLSVELVGDLCVRITAPRALVGAVQISYADPCASAGMGNLCDSDASVSAATYGYAACAAMDAEENVADLVGQPFALPNWAMPQLINATRD